jgi:hypothetical protein
VTVTLSSTGPTTGNGQPGENDSITGIQNIDGALGGYNVLTGDSADNAITGGPAGNTLTGGSGTDTLIGGAGNDIIDAGTGTGTKIYGAGGNDQIDASQGTADTIACGPGDPSVKINSSEVNKVAGDCGTPVNVSLLPYIACETPGELCNGKITPYPVLASVLVQPKAHRATDGYAVMAKFEIAQIKPGVAVQLNCHSPKSCPFSRYFHSYTIAQRSASLLGPFRRLFYLKNGTAIDVRITAPTKPDVGRYYVVTIVRSQAHTTTSRCISPVNGQLIRCPPPGHGYVPPPRGG